MNLILVLVGLTFAPTQAIDVRELAFYHTHTGHSSALHPIAPALLDVPLTQLRGVALQSKRGGGGFYPTSDFVHVDTARVRHW